jgi:hypothetical protein
MITCKICGIRKPENQFYPKTRQCKSCKIKKQQARRTPQSTLEKKEYDKQRCRDNPELQKQKAEYYQKNKREIVNKQVQRRKNDQQYRLTHNLRNHLVKAIRRGYGDKARIGKLLTITHQEFIQYIESKFYDGMTWDNYGGRDGKGWELDHIKPLNQFDLTIEEQVKECFHFSNIRPLWAKDNKKRNRED